MTTDQNENKNFWLSPWEVETTDPHSRSLRLAARFARVGRSQRVTDQTGFFAGYARAGARAYVARPPARGTVIQVTKPGFPAVWCTNVRFLGCVFDWPTASTGDHGPELARFPALYGPLTA